MDFNWQAANASTIITQNQQESIDFNNAWSLVRDQEVGVSNLLAPIIPIIDVFHDLVHAKTQRAPGPKPSVPV